MPDNENNNVQNNTNTASSKKKNKFIESLKRVDLKHATKVFTLIWGLILIVIMTITNLGFNEKFNLIQWLSNSLIIFGILVFGLFMGETSGSDKQMQKEDGLYQISLRKYEKYNEEISEELVYFGQWYSWFLPQEIEGKKVDYLIMCGVDPAKSKKIVKYCTKKDIEELKNHVFEVLDEDGKRITVIRQLEEHEIEPVTEVLSGVVKLHSSNANYFLTAFSESGVGDRITEEGYSLQQLRKSSKRMSRIIKIGSSLGISLIWGLLTVNDFINGNDTQAWVNLVSRISALFTSFFSGWMSSVKDVKIQARILINKYKVLKMFHIHYTKKIFMAKSDDEIADEELKAYNKKKEENRAVVEIVEGPLAIPEKGAEHEEGTLVITD